MENCVAFGAIFDSNTSTEHQYNEQVLISDLKKAYWKFIFKQLSLWIVYRNGDFIYGRKY